MYGPSLGESPLSSFRCGDNGDRKAPRQHLGSHATPAPGPGPSEMDKEGAARAIQSDSRKFRNHGAKLRALMQRAARAKLAATAAGDEDKATQAGALVVSLGRLNHDWGQARDRLDSLLDKIPGLGIPVIPIVYGATAIALAGTMAAIFRRTTAQERLLRLIETEQLTPAEAERLGIEADAGTGPLALGGLGSTLKGGATMVVALGALMAANAAGVFKKRGRR